MLCRLQVMSVVVRGGFLVSLLGSFALLMFPLRNCLVELLWSKQLAAAGSGPAKGAMAAELEAQHYNGLTYGILASTVATAVLVPDIWAALSIVGDLVGGAGGGGRQAGRRATQCVRCFSAASLPAAPAASWVTWMLVVAGWGRRGEARNHVNRAMHIGALCMLPSFRQHFKQRSSRHMPTATHTHAHSYSNSHVPLPARQ